MVNRLKFLRPVATAFCIATVAMLTGCAKPPVPAADYRTQFPIGVQTQLYSLTVPVSGFHPGARGPDLRRARVFAADYLRRGRGPLLVSHGSGAEASGEGQSAIVEALRAAGVPRDRIYFQAGAEKNLKRDTAQLSFSGYTLKLPECGDWSGTAGFDPSNRTHTNFGCSFQRNTGLMLSYPGDLFVAGDHLERDTRSSDRVIRTYRDGKAMGTPLPLLEQRDFSDVK